MAGKTDRGLDVLLPDIDVEVTDPDTRKPVSLTVREYRFLKGLEAQVAAAPLLADLAGHMDADGATPGIEEIQVAVGRHAGVWMVHPRMRGEHGPGRPPGRL